MAVKVAINGFGRIGRLAFRQMFGAEGFEIVAINDLTSPKMLAHLLKYDSTQGKYELADKVSAGEDSITVDGKEIKIYAKANAAELPWGEIGVDVVLECTGFYTSKAKAQAHIDAGAKHVIISAPAGNDLKTIVYNVNHETLTKEDHIRDAELIEEIGANTVRLAHYQHAQEFYDECDKRGFVVWAEIPFISVMNEDPLAHENCITQLKELIYQNDHHPSICFWGISNEILIGGISEKLVENHRELNALAKKIDPYRLTTIAHVTMTPKDGPMHEITDVESYNHYFGWYGGKTEDNGPWMDEYHEKYPNRCIGLSEYGCEGIITYQGENPKCKDYSEAYQAGYHEYMAHMLERRPWIFCSYVWNMFDFGCAARSEGGVTGRNNKGLVTMDRKIKKDSFYLYKAYWNPEPMVHICDKRYSLRSEENTQIRVYTNQERVTLFVNGEEMAVNEVKRHVASFPISLSGGKNAILVKAGDVWDAVTIERVEKEPESYVFPEASEREEGVANWFQEIGSLNLSEEMKYPEDRYHIRCTLEEISENDEAMELVTKAMKLITGMTLAKEEGMWDMMKKMKLESMKEMLGAMAPDGFLESLNMKLNEIKKENLNG